MIDCSDKDVGSIIEWCDSQFNNNWEWHSMFPSDRHLFRFPDDRALNWFKLKWE